MSYPPFHKYYPEIKVGDRFTMSIAIRRKWWQFWKPKIIRHEQRDFEVNEVVADGGPVRSHNIN